MAGAEHVIVGGKHDPVLVYGVGHNRCGPFDALEIAPAHHITRNHQLIATHGRVGDVLLRVDIDQLDDPVAVGTRGRGKEVRGDLTRDDDVFLQGLGRIVEHVRPPMDEALILDLPRAPARL